MPTIKQLTKKAFRKNKYRKLKTPALDKNSQKKVYALKFIHEPQKSPTLLCVK